MASTSYAEFGAKTTGTEVAGRFAGRIEGKVGKWFLGLLWVSVIPR